MFRQKNFFEILLSSNIHVITYFASRFMLWFSRSWVFRQTYILKGSIHIHFHFLFLETEVWRIREKNTFQDFPIDNKVKENITIIFDGRSFGLSRLSDRETIYGWNYSKKFCCSYKVNRAATGACGNLWLVRFRWRFYKCKMKVSVFLAPLCSASEHFLNLSCIMLQNGLTHFKKLAAFTASLLKYVDLFGTLCIKGLKHYKWREKPRKYD